MLFDLALLEGIDPKLLRDERTYARSGDKVICIARNLSMKTKENWRNDITHTSRKTGRDCAISSGRQGDWLLELCKR